MFAELGDEGELQGNKKRIAQWFWCVVLGEMYGGTTETRFANDFADVVAWIRGEKTESRTIVEANFQANRLLTLRTRRSAAYKGIHALLMRDGCRDFLTSSTVQDQTSWVSPIDIHHIFPRAWSVGHKIDSNYYESIINKTGISARTNRIIGGRGPSVYLPRLQSIGGISEEEMDENLESHKIGPSELRADNFAKFFERRGEALLTVIESAMGKPVSRELGLFSLERPIQEQDEEPTDWTNEPTD